MKPFIREVGRARLAPVGWTAEAAGTWAGREIEVVFDPDRHQVTKFLTPPSTGTKVAMAGEGYRPLASDGHQEMWVRDLAATRVAAITTSTSLPLPHGNVARGL